MRKLPIATLLVLAACASPTAKPPPADTAHEAPSSPPPPPASATVAVEATPPADAGPPRIDPDGDDEPVDTGSGNLPARAHFERVGKPPASLWRICDLTPFHDALYAAHATQPLGLDGATITRYQPPEEGDKKTPPFRVAFDWNRYGEPTTGGGAGQGFLRVHHFGDRLFVTDADPPYNGFGISERGTEGFVFVSDPLGNFAPARAPGHRPPLAPADGGAGAGVLPRAYHVIDVIRFRGRYYASTGSVPPTERAWNGPSPGALHVASADLSRWTYEVDYPYPWQNGVWRLTYMVRFKDRLYAGIQDYDGREPNDYVYFAPPRDAQAISHDDAHAMNVTGLAGTSTLRWYADRGKLYWIALQRDGNAVLRVTKDGDTWRIIGLPMDGGRPTDITHFRGSLVVLTERRLYRLGDDEKPTAIAEIADKKSPFQIKDTFCVAPVAVYRNRLYAGGQVDGALYRLEDGEAGDAGVR